jgi:acetyltransferase-like isoleucine patch superfamily enzyme
MKKIATAVFRLLKENPVGIALSAIAGHSWNRMTSFIMALQLKAPGLRLGAGCRIIGGRHISFGRGVFAGRGLWLEAVTSYRSQRFDPKIAIGDHVCFSDGVHITSIASIAIGSHSLFGSKIYVSDHNHGIYSGQPQSSPEEAPAHRLLGGGGPVLIGENVWIGDNSVIIGPATIGRGAVIGANSVVRGVVPPNTIVVGVPAKPVKFFNSKTGSWDKA